MIFYFNLYRLEVLKRLCDVMSGDIIELRAMLEDSNSNGNHSNHLNSNHLPNNPKLNVMNELKDEEVKEHLLGDDISVADVLSRPTFRQTSASTFLCPGNIPGNIWHCAF